MEAMRNMASKMHYKHEKMIRTLSSATGPVLFVRYGANAMPAIAWPYNKEPESFDLSQLDVLTKILANLFPKLIFRLLFVYEEATTMIVNANAKLDQRVSVVAIQGDNNYRRWEGDDRVWDRILDNERNNILLPPAVLS